MNAERQIPIDDAEALTRALMDLATSSDIGSIIAMVVDVIMRLSKDNKAMAARLQKLMRKAYASKSEKLTTQQLDLFNTLLQNAKENAADATENGDGAGDNTAKNNDKPVWGSRNKSKTKSTKGHGRKKLPPHLPREVHLVSVPPADRQCAVCGTQKRCIGHTTSERLEYLPGSLIVLQEKREKLACKPCQGSVVTAPLVPHIVEGGLAGEGLIAYILASKYIDGLTLTRLSKILAREGVCLAESTLGDIVKQGTSVLPRLAAIIQKRVLSAPFLNQDDSGLRVLDKEHPKGIKRGHIWAYVAGADVVYIYSPDWSGEHPRKFLRAYSGIIQGDGYSGISKLFTREANSPTRAGCMMHCRRYFFEAYKTGDTQAGIALAIINELYAIEHSAKSAQLDETGRLNLRQSKSLPRMQRLQRWITQIQPRTLPKSALGQALTYATRQWDSLLVPFFDGRMEIDNSEAERRLKVLAIGRKNWLFAGSDQGAERAALALTVLGTAVNHGLNPVAYLTDVFRQIAGGLPRSRFGELHPAVWAEKRGQQAAAHQAILPRIAV